MPIENRDGGMVITGEAIRFAQALAQRSALKLETYGMKRKGRPMSVVIREQYGFTEKNKTKLLALFDKWIEDHKAMAQQ